MNLSDIRQHYLKGELTRNDLDENPFDQFNDWMSQAMEAECQYPTAMTLSTVGNDGRPDSRIVLLKEVLPQEGFVFFTNYESKKGKDLEANPYASVNFFWAELERQVRINGRVRKVLAAQSDTYFQSRPRESQLGALASDQSSIITNKVKLETRYNELDLQFKYAPVPRPEHWGGYVLIPEEIEFWQGRTNRLHDRFRYLLTSEDWCIQQLAP